ncbi:hypothetical protein C8R46DRAFT_989178 [Mycena filopes]|nr:hypothetical protein C8R46DRAFT_989178 [Mycena filopes]
MANDDGFVFTDDLVTVSNQLWAITAIVGASLCGAVLIIIGIAALNPVSRPHLDRVSFRILVWALLANTVFGITNAIGGKFTGPTWACGFTIWLLQLTLEMSSFLLFSIALNLQLVVIHQIDGQKMEKFYIYGSILISMCLTVPPYAAKQYGWDPLVQDCWYSNDNPKERLAWQIGTQLFWTLLTVAGEVITASSVIIYMVRHRMRTNRLQNPSVSGSRTRSRSGSTAGATNKVAHANVYRGIIFRIILYPIASALINLTSVACVIHATQQDGVHNWTGYRVLLVSDFVYGGRAGVYALLAATDPALVRALNALIQHKRGSSATTTPSGLSTFRGTDSKNQNLSVHVELTTIYQNDSRVMTGHGNDAPPFKYPPTPHDGTHFEAGGKLRSDVEEGTRVGNDLHVRLQAQALHHREEAAARDEERQQFQKQI